MGLYILFYVVLIAVAVLCAYSIDRVDDKKFKVLAIVSAIVFLTMIVVPMFTKPAFLVGPIWLRLVIELIGCILIIKTFNNNN